MSPLPPTRSPRCPQEPVVPHQQAAPRTPRTTPPSTARSSYEPSSRRVAGGARGAAAAGRAGACSRPLAARAARRAAGRLRVHRRRARREGRSVLELRPPAPPRRASPRAFAPCAAARPRRARRRCARSRRERERRGGFTRPTAGTVAYLAGSTLYVTNAEGNTVKVTTSPATSVTKTVKASVKGIHPGETVTVTGASGANGAVSAESISVGSGGGALRGAVRRRPRRRRAPAEAAAGSSRGSEPSLFGGRLAADGESRAGRRASHTTQITNKGSPCLTSTAKAASPARRQFVLVLASLALAACGGSSSTTGTTPASASSTAPGVEHAAAKAGASAQRPLRGAPRMPAEERHLAAQTHARPTPRRRRRRSARRERRHRPLPKGVTRAQYEAALKKCGGGFRAALRRRYRLASTARQPSRRSTKFAACMRENGVNVRRTEHLRQRPDLQHQGHQHDEHPVHDRRAQVPELPAHGLRRTPRSRRHGRSPRRHGRSTGRDTAG